jgi:hypothetical protein
LWSCAPALPEHRFTKRHKLGQCPFAFAEPPINPRVLAGSPALAMMSGETCVGTLVRQVGGTLGDRWFRSITCVLTETTARIGYAETREEAQTQLAEAWRDWLKRTGLQKVE